MNDFNKDDTLKSGNLSNNKEDGIKGSRDTMKVEDAVINSIFTNNRTGYVTITYGITNTNQTIHGNVVTLVIGENTRMRDQFGNKIGLRNLKEDMVINARFSSVMTRSNPPQSRAYHIVVIKENESSIIEEGNVLKVENLNEFDYILTGYENDIYSQIRYGISDTTKLRDRRGNRIDLGAIRPGQIVRIERANFETASIPPQTIALTVQIISC